MLYVLAIHIIFVITWFAGLFYIVRLFVYHSEVSQKPSPEKEILISHFKLAEKRLWYGITWPSALLTWITGGWLAVMMYGNYVPAWLILKIVFVALLTVYHFLCGRILNSFARDSIKYTGMQMRMWNEVATVFLFAIVFIVVLKDLTNWMYGFGGLMLLSLLLFVAIKIYRRVREKKSN